MSGARQLLPPDPGAIAAELPGARPRVLLLGAMGSGKSTLALGLARSLGRPVHVLSADPGSPAFGIPGAVNLGVWQHDGWRTLDVVPLCTLDAARFRLPLVQAVARLAGRDRDPLLVIDSPGVVRGIAGAEILQGFAAAAGIDAVVVLHGDEAAPLPDELGALGCAVLHVRAAAAARRPARGERERRRTALWDAHLASASIHEVCLDTLSVTGTPPPLSVPEAWQGRQVALLRGQDPVAIGEIAELCGSIAAIRLPAPPGGADTLLIRDAERNAAGVLVTAPRLGSRLPRQRPPAARLRDPVTLRVGGIAVRLVNGVLGDPLVELRVPNVGASLLFDLGDAAGLPLRALHDVSDVFVTHGHIDHIGGFPTLLRARLSGNPPPCRIYGPPGIREHVAGFLAGIRWDRIGDTGPVFLVAEASQRELCWTRLQPGCGPRDLGSETVRNGVLHRGDGFCVRSATLDHGIPVLAFLLELADGLHVRPGALGQQGLTPGPWLGELKRRLAAGETAAEVTLPDGARRTAGILATSLIDVVPGTRIGYATDLADTGDNRRTLAELADAADLLICEAAFLDEDAGQARATGHLTVPACVAIARDAGVARLLPFHFSRRYSHRLADVHEQLDEACRITGLAAEVVGPG